MLHFNWMVENLGSDKGKLAEDAGAQSRAPAISKRSGEAGRLPNF